MKYDAFIRAWGDAAAVIGVDPHAVAMNDADWQELAVETLSEVGPNFGKKVNYSTDDEGLVRIHGCVLMIDDHEVVAGGVVFLGIPKADKFKLPTAMQHNRMFLQRAIVRETRGLDAMKVTLLMREWKGMVE